MRLAPLLVACITIPMVSADPVTMPDQFPVPMTFKPFITTGGGKTPEGRAKLEKLMEAAAHYPVIHGPGTPEFCKSWKQGHPGMIVIQGGGYGGIEPNDEGWPGHYLYKAGTRLLADCPATARDTILRVENPSRLAESQRGIDRILSGRKQGSLALIIYALDEEGRPDWSQAEHVLMTNVNKDSVTVRRGQWGSKPLAFKVGKAVVAGHVMFWSNQWHVNFSLHCPRGGPNNLTAAEWYAHRVAEYMKESGADGVEFDVGRWTFGYPQKFPMDCDNDMTADYGYINGVNSFGLGGQVFFRELRRLLGPDKIIQVDGNDPIHGCRGWKYLNGIQIEVFPFPNSFDRYSENFLHLRLWTEKAEGLPRFSYGMSKIPTTLYANERLPGGGSTNFRFRVGLASMCMVGMPHPFANAQSKNIDAANDVDANPINPHDAFGVFDWDEYHGGELNNWHWLGRPLGPARQDTGNMDAKDLLADAKWNWTVDKGFGAQTTAGRNGEYEADVKKTPANVIPETLWSGVRLAPESPPKLEPSTEYTLVFEARGDDRWEYAGQVFEGVPRTTMIQGLTDYPSREPMATFVCPGWETRRISFTTSPTLSSGPVFGVSEQIGKTAFRNIRLYRGGAERWEREFENGLVLINMTRTPWEKRIGPGYRRLKGSLCPDVNTGEAIKDTIVVPVWDAVFLVKNTPSHP